MRCSDARAADARGVTPVRKGEDLHVMGAATMRLANLLVALRTLVGMLLLAVATSAAAHKASDAYLQVDGDGARTTLRWDIALRDLDVALDLDADGDGKLTWREVREAWPRIEAFALPQLGLAGCTLATTGRALERRSDGAYAVLHLAGTCTPGVDAAIRYTLFADVDPTHRGIAKIARVGQPLELRVLDPVAASATPTASTPRPAASAAPARDGKAHEARAGFFAEGIRHILTGYDHVLFLLCLLLPSVMRRQPGGGWEPLERLPQAVRPIVGIVTAFTLAHSITLCLAALDVVTLPAWFIEPAIALTIVLAALDNVVPVFPVRRIVVAFVFGLIHGFGFAGVLRELDLPAADFAAALLTFNLGLEFGQLLIVAAATTLLFVLRARPAYRPVVIRGGSYAAMACAGVWFVERTTNLVALPF